MIKKLAVSISVVSFSILAVYASNIATDEADNSPYTTGPSWSSGQNGGSGFGAWTLDGPGDNNGAHGGFFIGDSSNNAGGSSGNINTSGVSWGMYANNSQVVDAIRPFTGGSLNIGQELDFKIDNGFLSSGSTEGFGLQTSGGANRLEFYFTGGNSDYTLADNAGNQDSGIGFTGNGLSITFALQSADTYLMTVTPNGGPTSTFSGTLEGVAGTGIDQLRFFDFNGGNGLTNPSDGDFYVNELAVVPEPSTIATGVLAVLGAFLLRRRRVSAV